MWPSGVYILVTWRSLSPAVELVGVLLTSVVEVEAQLRLDTDPEVVVHDEDLGVVFAGGAG